jgi:hypothetical protein
MQAACKHQEISCIQSVGTPRPYVRFRFGHCERSYEVSRNENVAAKTAKKGTTLIANNALTPYPLSVFVNA